MILVPSRSKRKGSSRTEPVEPGPHGVLRPQGAVQQQEAPAPAPATLPPRAPASRAPS